MNIFLDIYVLEWQETTWMSNIPLKKPETRGCAQILSFNHNLFHLSVHGFICLAFWIFLLVAKIHP